jgi:hypothetical protein
MGLSARLSNGIRSVVLPVPKEIWRNNLPTYRYPLDRSFLRRNNVKDAITDMARKALGQLPSPVAVRIKKALEKKVSD